VSLQFHEFGLYSYFAGFIYGVLLFGWALRPPPPRASLALRIGLWVIVGSALASVPVSVFFGNVAPTIILAGLTVANWLYYWSGPDDKIFYYLAPFWLVNAGVVIVQWFLGADRALGLTTVNANATAAMLLLGAIWFMFSRYKWAALPFVAALPLTGSRWTVIVAVLVLGGICASRSVPSRWLFPGIVAAVTMVVLLNLPTLAVSFRFAQNRGDISGNVLSDTATRFDFDSVIGKNMVLPVGFIDTGIHSLPLRMSVETGLISALVWLALTGWTIGKTSYQGAAFWMMVTLGLLSVMYYHIWLGPNGAFWWLIVSMVHRRYEYRGYITAEVVEEDNEG